MSTPQLALFKAPPPAPKPPRLGANQQAVLARIDRYGWVRAREAGRIVYLNRGHRDPTRVPKEWIEGAGLRVLISLRRHGLVRSRRDGAWIRRSTTHLNKRRTPCAGRPAQINQQSPGQGGRNGC